MSVEVIDIPSSPRVWFLVAGLLRWNREQKIRAQKFLLGGKIVVSIGMLQPALVILFNNPN